MDYYLSNPRKPMSTKTHFLSATAFGLSLGLATATTIFDDFNDGNDTSPRWEFSDLTGALGTRGFGPNNDVYRLTGPATVSVRADLNFVDGEVRSDMTAWNPNVAAGTSMGILFRFNPANNAGYFLSIDADGTPAVALIKFAPGGAPSTLGQGSLPVTYDPAKNYILQVIAAGAKFTCRIYEKGAAANTLLDEFVVTDSNSPYAGGLTGYLVANDDFPNNVVAAAATFDNFFATDGQVAQPVLATPTVPAGQLTSSFVREAGRPYVVEFKTDLNVATWQVLANIAPKPLAGTEPVVSPTSDPMRAIRVKSPPVVLP
jgi:hypothetical protein